MKSHDLWISTFSKGKKHTEQTRRKTKKQVSEKRESQVVLWLNSNLETNSVLCLKPVTWEKQASIFCSYLPFYALSECSCLIRVLLQRSMEGLGAVAWVSVLMESLAGKGNGRSNSNVGVL